MYQYSASATANGSLLVRVQKKASQAVQQGATHRIQIQKNIVAIVAVIAVMMMFWLSAVPALNWFERTGDAAEHRDARARWLAANIKDYEFSYDIACLCDDATSAPVRVLVRGGEFVRAVDSAGGRVVDIPEGSLLPRDMIDVFDRVSRVLDNYPASLEVEYHNVSGYPVLVRVDPDKNRDGDETGYYLAEFQALAQESIGK